MHELLELLRNAADSGTDTHADGSQWACVYLPNVAHYYDNGRRFAGLLSALEQAGLYRPSVVDSWGSVKLC